MNKEQVEEELNKLLEFVMNHFSDRRIRPVQATQMLIAATSAMAKASEHFPIDEIERQFFRFVEPRIDALLLSVSKMEYLNNDMDSRNSSRH